MKPADAWRSLSRALIGDPELTSSEVAAQANVGIDHARRLWRALGFPPVPDDERVFTRSDVEMLREVGGLLGAPGAAVDVVFQLTRVTGQSLARLAEAQVGANAGRFEAGRPAAAPVPGDGVVGEIAAAILASEPFLDYVWRRHLLAALIRFSVTRDGPSATSRSVAVGFADLVGFTAISQQLNETELAAMVDRFEALAYEQIPERGGRVVKMIGDEVMFVVDDAAAAAEIALALVDAYAGDRALPEVRVGLSIGPTLSWEGDLFGPTVNLASRLVNIARPGTVLVSEELGGQLQQHSSFAFRHLRPVRLKGIGRVRIWVLRRLGDEGASPASRRVQT